MPLDKHSPEVRHITDQMRGMVEKKRDSLERPAQDLTSTNVNRGFLKGLRWAIDLIEGTEEENE